MADAMQNPRRLSNLSCVLKPKAVEGTLQKRKSRLIFDLVFECIVWAQKYIKLSRCWAKSGGRRHLGQTIINNQDLNII